MTPETGTVEEERLAVELPADLLAAPTGDAPDPEPEPKPAPSAAAASEEPPTVVEDAPAPEPTHQASARRPMVPKAALDEERGRRKFYQQKAEQLDAAREQYRREALAYRAEREARERTARERQALTHPDYNKSEDLGQAIRQYDEVNTRRMQMVQDDMERRLDRVREEALDRFVLASERQFRRQHEDYDDVLKRSGVEDAIKPDPETGRRPDEFLWQQLRAAPDPAEAAYVYAKGRLYRETEATAEERGATRARKELVSQLHAAADRPRGISKLPSGTTPSHGITRSQIAAMSDEQKARLKRERSDVWEWYLSGA